MAHLRPRYIETILLKAGRLWPVIGLVGPRQSGKTTVFSKIMDLGLSGASLSMDDLALRNEATHSPQAFIAKHARPMLIDEIQKAPELFDAIKLSVDRKRIPGSFYVTGSTAFSSRAGVRESLTGRIGVHELLPLTLGEAKQKPFVPVKELGDFTARCSMEEVLAHLINGGMPVPMFLRSPEEVNQYWSSWMDTTLNRDLPRLFKRRYDSDLAWEILSRMGKVMLEGELPTLKHFKVPAAKLRDYLDAFSDVFLVRKIRAHEEAIAKDAWIFADSGMSKFFMGTSDGEGAMLSLARHFLWNEWAAQKLYQGERFSRCYFKTAQGSPVDWVSENALFRVVPSVTAVTTQFKWEERPLVGAMKKLGVKYGYLVAPVETVTPAPKQGGVGILPWGYWS